MSPAVQRELRDAIPEAELFESLWVWTDTPAARLVMGDWRRTLVSVFADGAAAGDDVAETAIRGVGEQNSLVVVKRAMVAWRLDDR